MSEQPNSDNFELVEKRSWQVVAKDADNEPQVFDLEYEKHKAVKDIGRLLISQAPPVKITPSRAKPVERDYKLIVDLPDIQMDWRYINGEYVPIHNETVMKLGRMACMDLKPDTIVIGGDNVDMAVLSRFEKDSLHFSGPEALQMAIDGLSKFLGQLRSENPNSRIVMLEGNHDKRLKNYVLKNAEKLYGLKRANSENEWPVNTLPFLLRTDEMGIEWVSGYPAAEFRYSDDLTFVHGQKVRSNGSTAELYSKDYETNVVLHHIHRQEMHTRTTHLGKQIVAISFGTMASTQGPVPSYHNAVDDRGEVVMRHENWQNGFGLIYDYDGEYQFLPVRINGNKARVGNREYIAD